MTAPDRAPPRRLDRAAIRLSIRTLDVRAEASDRVVISGRFAKQLARYLKRLLEREG